VASRLTARPRARALAHLGLERFPWLLGAGRTILTFGLVNLGWVLFRARNLEDALAVYRGLLRGWAPLLDPGGLETLASAFAVPRPEFALSVLLVLLLVLLERGSGEWHPMALLARQPASLRWPCYYGLVLAILVFGIFDDSPFIYFQF
jgi:hypothetical protein